MKKTILISMILLGTLKSEAVKLSAKALLNGCYIGDAMMHDSLRTNGVIPLLEPYTGVGFYALSEPSGEYTTDIVLSVTGHDAIIDWIFVELRDNSAISHVVATRRALIQRDGDIVDVDGISPLDFPTVPDGYYYISIKHRNHLGVMTLYAYSLYDSSTSNIDFRYFPLYEKPFLSNQPSMMDGPLQILWSGDANRNKNIKYNGLDNDKNIVLVALGGDPLLILHPAYRKEDVNMDATLKYNGTNSDRSFIINILSGQNQIINQHIPN